MNIRINKQNIENSLRVGLFQIVLLTKKSVTTNYNRFIA